jgi:hypothetical protein
MRKIATVKFAATEEASVTRLEAFWEKKLKPDERKTLHQPCCVSFVCTI